MNSDDVILGMGVLPLNARDRDRRLRREDLSSADLTQTLHQGVFEPHASHAAEVDGMSGGSGCTKRPVGAAHHFGGFWR